MGTYRVVRLRVPRARSAQTRNISIPVTGEGLTYVAGSNISNHTQLHGIKTTENFGDGDKHIHLSPRHARKLLSIYAEMEHTAQYAALEASEISYHATNATTTAQTAHNTLLQLAAQHTEVVARRRFTQAALADLNAKKQALTDAVATLKTKVEAFKQSEQITEASYASNVKPFVDAYTLAMEAYQAEIVKADEGKDGASVRPNMLTKQSFRQFTSKDNKYITCRIISDQSDQSVVFEWYQKRDSTFPVDIFADFKKDRKYVLSFMTEIKGQNTREYIYQESKPFNAVQPMTVIGSSKRVVFHITPTEDTHYINFYGHDKVVDEAGEVQEVYVKYWDFKLELIPEGELQEPTAYIPHVDDLKGEQGVQPITLKLSESAMLVKNNKGIRTLRPLLAHNGEDITAYSIATLGVIYRWRRQSPNGVDKKGKTDATWESQNVGRASIQIDTTEVWDETKFSVGMDKASADKIQNYIKTRK